MMSTSTDRFMGYESPFAQADIIWSFEYSMIHGGSSAILLKTMRCSGFVYDALPKFVLRTLLVIRLNYVKLLGFIIIDFCLMRLLMLEAHKP